MTGSTKIQYLQEKIAGLELVIELEKVIVTYLKPKVQEWTKDPAKPWALSRYVRQSSKSRSDIANWEQELAMYKELLLIAEITNEQTS